MEYKTKANRELFNAWRELGIKIEQESSIVQNDLELSEDELHKFEIRCAQLAADILQLYNKTAQYLVKSHV